MSTSQGAKDYNSSGYYYLQHVPIKTVHIFTLIQLGKLVLFKILEAWAEWCGGGVGLIHGFYERIHLIEFRWSCITMVH